MWVTQISLVLVALLWLVLLGRASTAVAPGTARSLWISLLGFATAGTLYAVPAAGQAAAYLLRPVGGAAAAWMSCAIVSASAARSFHIYLFYPRGYRQRLKLRRNLVLGVLSVALILGSFWLSPPIDPVLAAAPADLAWRAAFYVGTWQSVLRWMIWLAYLSSVLVWMARIGFRYAGYADRQTLGRLSVGIRLGALGCRIGCLYVLLKGLVVLCWLFGVGPRALALDLVADLTSLVSVACIIASASYDEIVLRVATAKVAAVRIRQLQGLRALDDELRAVAPEHAANLRAVGVRQRLSRRVVEIRDRELMLRAYVDPDAPARALAAAQHAGYASDEARSIAEAAWLGEAISAKRNGTSPRVVTGRPFFAAGATLEEEAAWLVLVAKARSAQRKNPVSEQLESASVGAPAQTQPRTLHRPM